MDGGGAGKHSKIRWYSIVSVGLEHENVAKHVLVVSAGLEHENAAKYVGVVTIVSAGLDHEHVAKYVGIVAFGRGWSRNAQHNTLV